MNPSLDRLYKLLPAVYRHRDAEVGFPLQALLQVINEQVEIVESDIAQLYENWFIETCQDWAVPYLADLLGYQPVHQADASANVTTLQGQQRNKILIPRRDVANTIRYRRRKGTLALLELLAQDVANWTARAVEFYQLLGWNQNIHFPQQPTRQTIDLRQSEMLDRLNSPFNQSGHTLDIRRINSHRGVGQYSIPAVGLFVWRLQAYSVTQTPAYCLEETGSHCYSFSVLGHDTPLYNRPQPEDQPTHIAEPLNLPIPISRRALQAHKNDYYGQGKSLQIFVGSDRQLIPADQIVVANLSHWYYHPLPGQVAVDPELGRITFPPGHAPKKGVWVSYHYGFSADIGGGEYDRPLTRPLQHTLYRVGKTAPLNTIRAALTQWHNQYAATEREPDPQQRQQKLELLRHAVIEIVDSEVYVEQISLDLKENQSLQIRAANQKRPVIRLLDWRTEMPDGLTVTGKKGSRLILDGLMITGRGIQIEGDLHQVSIRHSTLVPGWGLHCDCEPRRPAEPSIELNNTEARLQIEHSIVGSIALYQNQVRMTPLSISVSDSILDATTPQREAIGAPGCLFASATLTIRRSTVFGQIQTHAIDLAENCIFAGLVKVARRQQGCMRFCSVTPDSRTPRRYNCQPDLVEQAVTDLVRQGKLPQTDEANAKANERDRVKPQFNSTRYGSPTYCQLRETCAEEIKRGADDESEMGVFHDLYQPQREANLRTRLDEYTPAGMETGIIYAS